MCERTVFTASHQQLISDVIRTDVQRQTTIWTDVPIWKDIRNDVTIWNNVRNDASVNDDFRRKTRTSRGRHIVAVKALASRIVPKGWQKFL